MTVPRAQPPTLTFGRIRREKGHLVFTNWFGLKIPITPDHALHDYRPGTYIYCQIGEQGQLIPALIPSLETERETLAKRGFNKNWVAALGKPGAVILSSYQEQDGFFTEYEIVFVPVFRGDRMQSILIHPDGTGHVLGTKDTVNVRFQHDPLHERNVAGVLSQIPKLTTNPAFVPVCPDWGLIDYPAQPAVRALRVSTLLMMLSFMREAVTDQKYKVKKLDYNAGLWLCKGIPPTMSRLFNRNDSPILQVFYEFDVQGKVYGVQGRNSKPAERTFKMNGWKLAINPSGKKHNIPEVEEPEPPAEEQDEGPTFSWDDF